MKNINKFLLVIIFILVIAVVVIMCMYLDMKKTANTNLEAYKNVATKLVEMNSIQNLNPIIDEIKSIKDSEERALIIELYLENGNLTEEMAKDLY